MKKQNNNSLKQEPKLSKDIEIIKIIERSNHSKQKRISKGIRSESCA